MFNCIISERPFKKNIEYLSIKEMRIETQSLISKYKDNLFAAAFSICRNSADADDIVQETFLKYHTTNKEFESEAHIKAWLIRVAVNKAKNITVSFWNRNIEDFEAYVDTLVFETTQAKSLFEYVMKLPEKYRITVHLYYYEDYSVKEIAKILKISESNVKIRLARARAMLKESLKEDWIDE